MNCTKCNAPLNEGDLFCKSCGYQYAVNEQKQKLAQTQAKSKGLIVSQFRNNIFLAFTICFTVMFASLVISMLQGGFMGILFNVFNFIFSLIATIGLWKCYNAKDMAVASKGLTQASIYDAYQRVMYTILIVLVAIVAVFVFLGFLFAGGLASDLTDSETGFVGGLIAALASLIGYGIVIAIMSACRNIFKNRRAYFLALSKTVETGEYKETKAPVLGSYILGGWTIFCGLLPVIIGAAGASLIGEIIDALGEYGDLGGLEDVVDGVLSGLVGGLVILGLGQFICGAYYILSALWMTKVHEAEVANKAAVEAAAAALAQVEEETKVQYELESKKNQNVMQEQQMMMQMMMQKMMEQNGMASSDNSQAK